MIEIKNEKYYSPREISIKFGVTIGTVARWRQEGKITASQVSERKFLFSETELEKFVKGEK
jgi:excisionase family DNA binding protein